MSYIRENEVIDFKGHIVELKKAGHEVKCETSSQRTDGFVYIWVNGKFYLKLKNSKVVKVSSSGIELSYQK